MAHDEELARRVRALLDSRAGVDERKMFGGSVSWSEGTLPVASAAMN
jgi:hypothetical protein